MWSQFLNSIFHSIDQFVYFSFYQYFTLFIIYYSFIINLEIR